MSIADELLALELALARRDVKALPGGYEAVLDEAFVEFGSSGRVWTRAGILDLLVDVQPTDAISIEGFEAVEVADGVVLALFDTLATDHSTDRLARSHRSSLWVRHEDRWRMRFHQGTPVAERRI